MPRMIEYVLSYGHKNIPESVCEASLYKVVPKALR